MGWSQVAVAVALGERECACGDERIVMFKDGARVRSGKIVSVVPVGGNGVREVVIDSETKAYSEEAEVTIRYAGVAEVSAARVFSGQPAICIQACADRSGLF